METRTADVHAIRHLTHAVDELGSPGDRLADGSSSAILGIHKTCVVFGTLGD